MLGIHDYPLFIAAGMLLNLTPGQDTIYIVTRSVAHGRRVGLASALGCSTGGLVHTFAAALGLSAILAASAALFTIVKLVGAAYLVFLGVRMLISRAGPAFSTENLPQADVRTAYWQGALTNVLNPKVAIFYIAFMPQFIDPDSPTKFAAFVLLGLTLITTGTIWCIILALGASRVSARLNRSKSTGVMLNRCAGGIFVLLGLRLATDK